ncbi:hypothetical protein J3459_013627 [Metarhizium acridum]|uniref:uncharacterized protein n=1 Tax=Metarhizium acridum TaxID=92637 RepID=UPI001C6B78D4|nr:hypothetical protein J3458_013356 [Metarhizium acridum]KAG8416167.1 hypothetical protein J3459_013713 [Metarhizium acridum]KAG8416797.1 hypothetical protein J3459_013627 [Metarhizium acridum]
MAATPGRPAVHESCHQDGRGRGRGRAGRRVQDDAQRGAPVARQAQLRGHRVAFLHPLPRGPSSAGVVAGRDGRAVCVNRWGQFSIRSSGYAAIFQVWADTMGLEFNGEKIPQDERGLKYAHFGRIISTAVRSSGCKCFSLHLLAVPQIVGNEEEARVMRESETNIVNSLVNVYTNADTVIILDSLTQQLSSDAPCTVAAILGFGRWLTRMWTRQEIKLSRKAQVVTKTGTMDFEEMV